jgi:hypothetical protein
VLHNHSPFIGAKKGVSEKRCQEPFSGKRENAPFSGISRKRFLTPFFPDTFFSSVQAIKGRPAAEQEEQVRQLRVV